MASVVWQRKSEVVMVVSGIRVIDIGKVGARTTMFSEQGNMIRVG